MDSDTRPCNGTQHGGCVAINALKPFVFPQYPPQRFLVLSIPDKQHCLPEIRGKFFKLFQRHGGGLDQMNLIILHECPHLLIHAAAHLINTHGCVPWFLAKVNHQRDDGFQTVVFAESRQIGSMHIGSRLGRCRRPFWVLLDLILVLNRIIQHIPYGHRVVNVTLVFNAQYHIGGPSILHTNPFLEYIAHLLNRFLTALIAGIGHRKCCRIQFYQFACVDDMFPAVNQVIERIRKNIRLTHESFRQ